MSPVVLRDKYMVECDKRPNTGRTIIVGDDPRSNAPELVSADFCKRALSRGCSGNSVTGCASFYGRTQYYER